MTTASSFARKAVKVAVLPGGMVSRRRPGDVVILLYHRVGGRGGEIEVPAALFERQLEALAGRERVLTLDQAVAGDQEGGVVVTVDDGYRDFHDTVLPLLVRYRVPAVLYLATGLVAGEGPGPDDPDALTWAQLAEAVASGLVTVGAHTHGHTDLSRASEQVCRDEMARSQELVEDRLGSLPALLYPWALPRPPPTVPRDCRLGRPRRPAQHRPAPSPLALGRTRSWPRACLLRPRSSRPLRRGSRLPPARRAPEEVVPGGGPLRLSHLTTTT